MGAGPTHPGEAPARPDVVPAMMPPARRWLPTVVVALVICGVVFGGYLTAAALSETAGPPRSVGGIVVLRPPTGWQVVASSTVSGLPVLRLTRGGGNLDVVAVPGAGGSGGDLGSRYVDTVLSHQLTHLSVSGDLSRVSLGPGLVGERFGYVGITDAGASIEGEVTVVVTPNGDGVVFDGWAPEGLLAFVDGDIHTMIERAEFPR